MVLFEVVEGFCLGGGTASAGLDCLEAAASHASGLKLYFLGTVGFRVFLPAPFTSNVGAS